MSFALPEALREYIAERVQSGGYGNTSEYLRELIRRDQQLLATRRLQESIADGLQSGEGRPATDAVLSEIRASAFAADL